MLQVQYYEKQKIEVALELINGIEENNRLWWLDS
jgi:hypothetical protein